MNHTERRLVADINRWRKDRGWFDTNLGWVDANHTVRVRPTASGFEVWERTENGTWQSQPDPYYAPTLRSAVDILVALEILPAEFNSITRAVKKAYADLDAHSQRCPNCAPGYDCERGIYTPGSIR